MRKSMIYDLSDFLINHLYGYIVFYISDSGTEQDSGQGNLC